MEKYNSFFSDARGQHNIFTVIGACAGLTVVFLPWFVVWRKYASPGNLDTLVYANFFLTAACIFTDTALGMVVENGFWRANKAPDSVNVQTGAGPVNAQISTVDVPPASGTDPATS